MQHLVPMFLRNASGCECVNQAQVKHVHRGVSKHQWQMQKRVFFTSIGKANNSLAWQLPPPSF